MTARQRNQEDMKSGTIRRIRAVALSITGATGPSGPSINGVYEPTDEICGALIVLVEAVVHFVANVSTSMLC